MISRATLSRPAGVGANLSNAVRSGPVRSVVSVDAYCWSLRDAVDVVDILGDKVLSRSRFVLWVLDGNGRTPQVGLLGSGPEIRKKNLRNSEISVEHNCNAHLGPHVPPQGIQIGKRMEHGIISQISYEEHAQECLMIHPLQGPVSLHTPSTSYQSLLLLH